MSRHDEFVKSPTPGCWSFLHIGFEGDSVELDGVRLWDAEWGRTLGKIVVAHPQYPDQRHTMSIYRVAVEDHAVDFAAGEFSNGVWGFFHPANNGE